MIKFFLKSPIAIRIGFLLLPWVYSAAFMALALYINPHHYVAILRVRGLHYAREGDTDKAMEAYKAAIRIRPDHYFAWESLGALEEQLGNIKMAAYCFDRASALLPTNPVYAYHLSRLLLKMEEHKAALHHIDRALDVVSKPDDHRAILILKSEILKAMGREQESREILNVAETDSHLNNANPKFWRDKGKAFYKKRLYAQALEAFNQAIALDPKDTTAWQWKAAIYLEQKSYDQAIDVYDQILAYNPDNPRIVLLKGQTYAEAKQFEAALEIFDQAISAGLDGPTKALDRNETASSYQTLLLKQKASALIDLERYDEALEVFETTIEKSPQDVSLQNSKGVVLLMMERFEDAIKCFDDALRMDPDSTLAAFAWNNKGWALYSRKQYDEALTAFDQALILKDDYHLALYNRARAYVFLGNRDSAVSSLQRAIVLNPDYKKGMQSDEAFQVLKDLEVFK